MKKQNEQDINNELQDEYDVSQMTGVIRGKYAGRYKSGSNVIVLAPDVAEAFPNEDAVNEALRMLINIAKSSSRKAS